MQRILLAAFVVLALLAGCAPPHVESLADDGLGNTHNNPVFRP